MERLTSKEPRASGMPGVCCIHFRGGDCEAVQGRCSDGCSWEEAAWDRLAAYEDTGLGPEEITTEPYGCVFYCNRKCNLDGDFCAEGPGCPYEINADTAKHLLELAQAEKDGRLVVLPEGMVSMLMAMFVDEGDKDMITPIAEARGEEVHVAGLLSYLANVVAKYNHTDYVSLLKALIENPLVVSSTLEEDAVALKKREEGADNEAD